MPSANFYLNRPFQKGSGKKHATKVLNPKETMIFLYVSFPGRNIIKVSTAEKVLAKDWDFKKKTLKSTSAGSLAFNSRLAFLKSEVLQAIALATTENSQMTFSAVKQLVESVLEGKKISIEKQNFLEYYDLFLSEVEMKHKITTVKKFKSFRNIISEYLSNQNILEREFYCESIDHDFELYFRNYLLNERKNVNNTVSKAFESLSTFMQWGIRKKIHKNSSFEEFQTYKRDKGDIIFLDVDEVTSIESLNLTGTAEVVRDIFLFALYTGGQRIGDVLGVRTKDISTNKNGIPEAWNLFQIKGKKTVKNVLPLLDKASDALSKYYRQVNSPDATIFPNLTEHYINRVLKDICEKAGIKQHIRVLRYRGVIPVEIEGPKYEFISFHSARRSFVSIGLKLGMSPELIIKFTGHTTTKVMREHYLGISDDFKRQELFKIWQPKEKSILEKPVLE